MRLPPLDLTGRPRIAWLAGITLIVLALLAVGGAALIRVSSPASHIQSHHQPPQQNPPAAAPYQARPSSAPSPLPDTTANEVAGLAHARPVAPATSPTYPLIQAPATRQPDLFARAFTKRLLTQDYRTPRSTLLAWVQAESATTTEPTVIGLVPAGLRDKWALYSLTQDQATPVIPPWQQWRRLGQQQGHTTVHIQQVSEPVAWSQAVLSGQVTDPGVTAREVDALITLRTKTSGQWQTVTTSIALTINLEGPPARSDYGFVTAITYDVAPATNTALADPTTSKTSR